MSYHYWIEYGYGVIISNISTTVKKIKELLKLAPEYNDEINDYFYENSIENPTLEDYIEFEFEENGLASILQKIILEAENFVFNTCQDFNGKTYLLYLPSYPWYMGKNEAALTPKDINTILNKYIGILTDNPPSPNYLECHNGG